ncbi:pro-FMRFamide-related neuropeptide VF [Dunckerocampus dactyliophorus]|uniref:pro-FMRFamide-related neuropeptide VF n=1 Tax=Dunckerocampus dactyliophorus TaxID=161453 RepID=UPI002406D994|nr:pro-FMRFamide-related neuropeptide VF [Dunckerocampus dactyliophorus]
MVITILLSALLMMMAGLDARAAVSDLKVSGKSIHGGKALQSSDHGRHTARKQTRREKNGDMQRSLDPDHFKIDITPTTSKTSLPSIVKIKHPTAQPAHMHINMPQRFGRENIPDYDKPKHKMPQRFGRSGEEIPTCVERFGDPELLQRKWRNSPYWRLLRILASDQLLTTRLYW